MQVKLQPFKEESKDLSKRAGRVASEICVAVSIFAALSGLADALKKSEAGMQVRRTINTHASIMVPVTVLALGDLAWRYLRWQSRL